MILAFTKSLYSLRGRIISDLKKKNKKVESLDELTKGKE